MFVCKGAKSVIKKSRKDAFEKVYIKDLIQEASKLDIEKEELLEMIKNYKG